MSGEDNHATVRLLAVLVMTPEEELAEFKRRCLDPQSQVRPTQLGAARDLLLVLSEALRCGADDDWHRIEQARDVLRRTTPKPLSPTSPQPLASVSPQPEAVPVPPSPAPAVPTPVAAPAQSEQTVGLGQMSPLAGMPLPFSGSSPAPESARIDDDPGAAAGQTATLGERSPVAHLAVPFAGSPSDGSDGPELTLEQYASMWASCEVDPSATGRIEQQYGIDNENERRALDARWRARLDANAPERARFQELLAQYREWIRRQQH